MWAHRVCVIGPAGFPVGPPGAGPPHQHQTLWRLGNLSSPLCLLILSFAVVHFSLFFSVLRSTRGCTSNPPMMAFMWSQEPLKGWETLLLGLSLGNEAQTWDVWVSSECLDQLWPKDTKMFNDWPPGNSCFIQKPYNQWIKVNNHK